MLYRDYMPIAISMWRTYLLMIHRRPGTLVAAQQKRAINKQNQYLQSVCKTHVRWQYGNYNLAKAFLEYPDTNLPDLVKAKAEYKSSAGYEERVKDSQPKSRERRDADTVAVDCSKVERARTLRAQYTNTI